MQQKLKTLQFIHLALCAGITAAYFFAGNLKHHLEIFSFDSSKYVYFLLPIIAIIFCNISFQVQLKKIDKNDSLEENFPAYQTASLIRWAILEGIAFVIMFYMPENIVFGIPILIYLFFLIPTEERFNADLQKT